MNKFLLLSVTILTALVVACGTPATSAPSPAPDPVALSSQEIDAENRGDTAAVLAYYTDDAVISGLGMCAQAPCVGKDAIRKESERGVATHTLRTRFDAQASGNTVTSHLEIQNDDSRAAGIARFIVLSTITFQGGKIASLQRKLDTSDSQTAMFLKFQQAQAPK